MVITLNYFGVTWSKIKIKVSLYVKMVSADYLENRFTDLYISLVDWSQLADDTRIDVWISRSKVKSTVTLNVKLVSAHFCENY